MPGVTPHRASAFLHPIVVDDAGRLVAGERRLRAVVSLGWAAVDVHDLGELSAAERDEIEPEENLQRKDLTAHERSKTVVRLAETGRVVLADTLGATAVLNLTGKLTARLDGNVSWFDFRSVTIRTLNSNQRFWSVEPSLTYQIIRPWRASASYTYDYTDFSDNTFANLSNHRLFLGTQFAFREWLALELSYRYGARRLHGGNTTAGGVNEFTGNQVMLTLTASPSFRF